MKNIAIIIFSVLFSSVTAYSQINFTEGTINANLNRSGIVDAFDNRNSEREVENIFLMDEWSDGQVVFINGDVFDQGKFRYNLKNNRLEILMSKDVIKVADLYMLRFFKLYEGSRDTVRFINISHYAEQLKTERNGIYEVLVNDKFTLLKHHFLKTIKADYVPAFDLGSTKDRIVMEEEYFILNDQNIYTINKKKDLLDLFEEDRDLKRYMKQENLKMKDETDLIDIIGKINDDQMRFKN